MLQSRNRQSRLTLMLVAILSSLVVGGFSLYSHFETASNQERWVRHTGEVMSELDLALSAVKDAETGVRGYVLTREAEYLEPYRSGRLEALEHVRRVEDMTVDNIGQQRSVSVLKDTMLKRFKILDDLQDAFRKNNGKIASNALQFYEGKSVMDRLRDQIHEMKQTEQRLLRERAILLEKSRGSFFWILLFAVSLPTIVIIFAFAQISRNHRRLRIETEEKELVSELTRLIAGDATLEQAGSVVLKFLSDRFDMPAGKIWTMNRGNVALAACYGVDANEAQQAGDNLALIQAAIDRNKVWRVNNVPANYWRISSSLGSAPPTELTFLPFSFQGRHLGVIEMATYQDSTFETVAQLQSLAETIGIGINAAQSRTQLQLLLERTQQQSEELQAQQEELKTNNEELEQQSRALESQQQALNSKNKELESAQVSLERKAADLLQSSQYKSEFLAKMSHELRTPLNGLLILSTLLIENKEKNLSDQQRQFAKSINNAGNDLLTLINDILDLSKIEARKLSLKVEEFTLGELFNYNRQIFEPQIKAKGLQFDVSIEQNLEDLKLFTDRQRLEQILRNFLSNAIKFTDEGSIGLVATYDSIAQRVRVTVKDSGIGIAKSKQEAIFEAFEQADSSVSRKYGGTGLGLTISRELGTLLGGKISLTSEEGVGSEFNVEFPVRLEPTGKQDAAVPFTNQRQGPLREVEDLSKIPTATNRNKQNAALALQKLDPAKKSILIVEDDHGFRSSIVDAVESYGFNPIEAPDGELALAILNDHTPDAILLDIKLPGISGLGILEMIKQIPHLRHIPVHMISALEYQHNALRMGAFGYLTKPVTIEKVRSALGRIEDQISKKLRRVLLIEDDERQNQAVSQLIAGKDIEVVSVKTGKAAVDKLKKSGFDCIILDLTLPDVSGFDLLSELRALEISLPPVVIYTGKDLSDDEEKYLRKFSESIVIKGVRSPERLLDEVNLFLHRVESLLPEDKREMLTALRSQEKVFEGRTVLIVDDDIRNIFALTSALESKGLQVRVARDGVEALEMVDKHHDINLILMDIMMPRMDGFEAMRRIRENKNINIRSLPIVALTAKAMREDHEKCMEAGASDYLPKPVNLENLMTVLKVWISQKGLVN